MGSRLWDWDLGVPLERKTGVAPTLSCFHLIPVTILGFSASTLPRNCGWQSHGGLKSQWGEKQQQVGTVGHPREFWGAPAFVIPPVLLGISALKTRNSSKILFGKPFLVLLGIRIRNCRVMPWFLVTTGVLG